MPREALIDAATRLEGPLAVTEVTVYTRTGCHLCENAEQLLQQYGLAPKMIDIDADPRLQARYTECVPVVVIDGKERFRGRVDPRLLRRLLGRD